MTTKWRYEPFCLLCSFTCSYFLFRFRFRFRFLHLRSSCDSLGPIVTAIHQKTVTPALVLSHDTDPHWLELCEALPRSTRIRHLDIRSTFLSHGEKLAESISLNKHVKRVGVLGTTKSFEGLFAIDLCNALSRNHATSHLQTLSIQAIDRFDDLLAAKVAEMVSLVDSLVAIEVCT